MKNTKLEIVKMHDMDPNLALRSVNYVCLI